MTPDAGAPRRVRVTSPRTAGSRPRPVHVRSEIDAQTRLGEIYVSSLVRAQGRLAILVSGALALVAGGIPLAYRLFPALDDVRVLGMPLAWVLLGFAIYPTLLALGWFYVRGAERNEADFTEMVDRS